MRTYIYIYHKGRQSENGNPTDKVTVYRMKKNKPILLGEPRQDIGYRNDEQAVCDIILDNEAGWGKRYQGKHGSENPVNDARRRHIYHEEGKKIQIFRVGG
jgi:hypothetical protein